MAYSNEQNYTLGRGKLYFAPFAEGTETPAVGERYIGNTPEFNLTIEQETLDHFSSDEGIREKDDSVPLQVNRTGTFITDNINPENIALFFFGDAGVEAFAGGAVSDEAFNDVIQGSYLQLGMSDANPTGARNLVAVGSAGNIVVSSGMTTFDEVDDYTVDMALGRVYIVPGGAIVDGTDLTIDYEVAAHSRQLVLSGSEPVEGALRYVASNPKGEQFDYYMPKVSLSPNGDYALKGDEWQQIPFNVEILKKTGREAIYIDGRPYNP